MTDPTDSEKLFLNIEEGEIDIKDVIKVEPSQSFHYNIDDEEEEEEGEEELSGVIKVDPDHSLLLEEDILGVPDHTAAALEVVGSLNAGSSYKKQELSTIELVRLDKEVRSGQKKTSSVATQCSPKRGSTSFPEMTNSSQTLVIPSSDQLPAARVPQPGENTPSQEDAERNRFYRYRYRETAAEDAERNKFYRHLSLPNKRGRPKKSGETAVSRRHIEMLTKHANKIRETKLKAKKVRMERERRKGLAQLFDNLQASVEGQTNSEKLPRWRSSYLAKYQISNTSYQISKTTNSSKFTKVEVKLFGSHPRSS